MDVPLALAFLHRTDVAHPVDVPLHNVSTQAIPGAQGPLQIDGSAALKLSERGAGERFGYGLYAKALRVKVNDGLTDAVHVDAIAHFNVFQDALGRYLHALEFSLAGDLAHVAYFLYDSCEHGYSTSAV